MAARKKCARDPHKAYATALKADARFSRELKRVYGRNSGDARYLMSHKDRKVEAAKKAKLRADACLRKSWGRDN